MTSAADVDVVVVGAGVVGLACAAELARAGREVVVVERHERPAQETSSRNSGVIHAGLYYPPGSLKAVTCVEGRELLYERCEQLGIPHRRLGKLIVATCDDDLSQLEVIRSRAEQAGAGALEWLQAEQVARLEPNVRAVAALWSEHTGIVDAHALVDSYCAELEAAGGRVVLGTRVEALEPLSAGWRVETQSDSGRFSVRARCVVNAAGLEADRVAALAGIDIDLAGWRIRPCKGDYFGLASSRGALVRHLVYPVPAAAGLGIHVTIDLAGRIRFGPDAEYVDEIDYAVDASKAARFAESIARYLPGIGEHDLFPEMAGIRPKLQGPGEAFRDFVLEESSERGAPGMVQLIGIESPGLTAAGALARRAAALCP